MKKLILLVILIITVFADSSCWKDAYGRGVGKPLSACRPGYERDGALCYPVCE